MQIPPQVSFRGIGPSQQLSDEIEKHALRLDDFCDHIDSCRVSLERPHRAADGRGGEYRVRVDLTVARGQELVVTETTTDHRDVYRIVRDAFRRAERRLKRLSEKQRHAVKRHEHQTVQGTVTKLFDGYGFIDDNGREIYFHRNSVLNGAFDELRVGTGVAYTEEPGLEGPQASTVRIVDGRSGLSEPPRAPH